VRRNCCDVPLAGLVFESQDSLPVLVKQLFNWWKFVVTLIVVMVISMLDTAVGKAIFRMKDVSYVLLDIGKVTAYTLTLNCSCYTLWFRLVNEM
jgi:hypothetical protein